MSEFNLPEGWSLTTLGDFIAISSGDGLVKSKMEAGNIPVYGGNGIAGWHSESNIEEATIVIGRVGFYCGSIHLTPKHAWVTDNAFITKFSETSINKMFLYWLLKSTNLRVDDSGTAQPVISGRKVYPISIFLPPLAEQQQIAQKLDELLAQVDTLKTRLDSIPKILKRFRQSVLAAAVSGRLTEDAEARKFKSLGEAGVSVKTGPFGSALHKEEYVSGGIPLVNPMHINDGKITPSDHMSVTEKKFSELLAWELKPGDVILGRRGEMGRAAVVKPNSPKMLCGTGSMVLRGDDSVLPEYLCMILRSSVAIDYFNKDAVGSTMVNLNQKVIKALEVFFPPLEEQIEIVRRVEQLFAYADQIEQRVKDSQARVNHLTQSILAKAFRGELTAEWRAQNPELISGENSAAALLERIKAERAVVKPKRKVKQ